MDVNSTHHHMHDGLKIASKGNFRTHIVKVVDTQDGIIWVYS